MELAAIAFLITALVLTAIVIVFLVKRFNRPASAYPACGACGYNLTGCPSNRCPECGRLFIDAGVITASDPRGRRRWLPPLLIGTLGFLMLMSAIGVVRFFVVDAQRSRAMAAMAQAVAAQQRAAAAAALRATTTGAATQPASVPSTP